MVSLATFSVMHCTSRYLSVLPTPLDKSGADMYLMLTDVNAV
jgi:hypothetical protein